VMLCWMASHAAAVSLVLERGHGRRGGEGGGGGGPMEDLE